MKRFKIDGLQGSQLILAWTKHQAILIYINEICGVHSLKDYEELCEAYCKDEKIKCEEF